MIKWTKAVAMTATAVTGLLFIRYRSRKKRSEYLANLHSFRPTETLRVSENDFAILGTFEDNQKSAVLVLEKLPFHRADRHLWLQCLTLRPNLQNDIYASYRASVSQEIEPFKVSLIYPATKEHIQKYSEQEFYIVRETPTLYKAITEPYIASIPTSKLDWIYNILEHKSESERILYEDTDPESGFIFLPNSKWCHLNKKEALSCLAIVHNRSLRSTRDLTADHLPLLCKIRDACLKVLRERFQVEASSLRVYFHYQPTYYHLHVHFTHIKISNGVFLGKAIFLDDVIYSLTRQSNHYKEALLTYVVGKSQHASLYADLVAANAMS
uniref:m7GpppX diphosphatase n=1 Tax=Albugo laibachii Nc14 TaxID=890382 RepID=F0WT69_9STRA|nr:scavenger mRNAdecapping enzyme DcpS putative [Albugo laibachii Nc14]|eukprot:CCA24557.1 scavenger mRNAdecapping enzyme DcpS putative [Albugo laibachii Nc14]